jgi:autotransporter translocation and assembly factor TamB
MRRFLKILLALLLVLLLLGGLLGYGLLPGVLENWGGAALLAALQGQLNGQVSARAVSGNPFRGLTYQDLVVSGPGGEVLRVARLELGLSFWSLATLKPRLACTLFKPQLNLVQDQDGSWNLSALRRPGPPPPDSGGFSLLGVLLRRVEVPRLRVEKGEVSLTRAGETRRFAGLELRADLSLGRPGQPGQEILIRQADLALDTPPGRLEGQTRLSYRRGLLQVSRFTLKLADQPVLSLKGEVCAPEAGPTCRLRGQLGPLPGAALKRLFPRWPVPWNLAGDLTASGSWDRLRLALKGNMGQAQFDLKGELKAAATPPAFNLDLELKGLTGAQLQALENLSPQKLEGLSPVSARLHLEGAGLPWKPRSLAARLDLEPCHYRETRLSQGRFTLKGDATKQEMAGQAEGNFGALTLKAVGQLLPLGAPSRGAGGELTLDARDFRPGALGLDRFSETQVTARLAGKFRLPPGYSLARAYLSGSLEARGHLERQPLKQGRARFTLEHRKLNIAEARVSLASLEASFQGSFSDSGLQVRFAAGVADLGKLPWLTLPVSGALQGEGGVAGSWKAPQVTLAARARRLAGRGLKLEAADLSLALNGWPPESGRLQLKGHKLTAGIASFATLNLTGQGESRKWRFEMAATAAKQTPRAELAGTADLESRPLVVGISRATWQTENLTVKNTAPFQVRFLPGLQVGPASFQVDGGTFALQGSLGEGELAGRLEMKNLEAALLEPLGLPVKGRLQGHLALAGTPRAPSLDGSLSLAAGQLRNVPLKTLGTTLSFREGELQISGALEEGLKGSRLSWRGSLPLAVSLAPFKVAWGEKDLYLKVHSDNANLALIAALSPEIQAAESPLTILLEARGNPRQPRVAGQIRWGAGSLQLRQAGTPYKLDPGEIRLTGDKVAIPEIRFTSDGTLKLSGELSLAAPQGPQLEGRAQFNNFLVLNRGGNALWENGLVDIRGPLSGLQVKGRLVSPRAQFRPSFFRSELDPDIVLVSAPPQARGPSPGPALWRQLEMDVALKAPGNVILKDPMAKLELSVSLRARKAPGGPILLGGKIRALKGTVDIQGRPFKVEKASLVLPGTAGQPILADLHATERVQDITLVLNVTGTVLNPQIRLESLPPLPPADVLSYLVFGAPTATLTKDQYLSLGQQSWGVLGGVTSKKINEILGQSLPFLGGFKVRSGMGGGTFAVGVERELTKNVRVSYERHLNEERGQYEQQVRIEYKFNRNLSIESQLTPRNSGADAFYNIDF